METQTLNELLEQLDEVMKKMEDTDISLEESFYLYETGMKMLKQCNDKIDAVEKKVLLLIRRGMNMNFNEQREQKVMEIERVLRRYLRRRKGIRNLSWKPWNIILWQEGKGSRPMMMQETYKMFGGNSKIMNLLWQLWR